MLEIWVPSIACSELLPIFPSGTLTPQLAHYPRFFTTSTHTADNSAYVVSYIFSQNKGPKYLLVIGNFDDLVLNFKTNRKALPFWLGRIMDMGHIICL